MGPREFYDELPSTQDRALALARDGGPAGTRVVARLQTLGRGRLSRSWESPPGGLYCSMILARPLVRPTLLPLAVGATLSSALREEFRLPLALKWPNDILVGGAGRPMRKLCGILTDEVRSPTLGRAVVVGIGVNVTFDRETFSPALGERVAALEEYVSPAPPLERVESIAVDSVDLAGRMLSSTEGARQARELCSSLLHGVGQRVSVDGHAAGTIEALGDDGELWLTTSTDRVAIWAGDVRVEEGR